MIRARFLALPAAVLVAGFVSACAMLRVEIPERPGQTLTVLLPDGEDENTGRATVLNSSGATNLEAARDATIASANEAPSRAMRLSESDVHRIFGDTLSALPPAPQRFTLYFRFESDELTDESRSMVPEILQAIKEHPVPELLIVGHTDTTGTLEKNFDLGRKRAEMVRGVLIEAGLEPSAIEVTSHGESDLLVPTADEVFEPRNRRVDISVR
jgi:outer membrane protein OmpA-like peptidoglycan-associated protein